MTHEKDTTGKTLVYLTVLQLLLVLLIAYQAVNIKGLLETALQPQGPAPEPSAPQPGAVVDVSADDDSVKGDVNAPVEIIEFSDYQCPFCARFWSETLPQIDANYIKTGKVKLIYRDFPLSFHPQAQKAAEAAECAGDQKKYYEMHDKIFENQAALSDDIYARLAGEIGLNIASFSNCMKAGTHSAEIAKDFADGQAAGVTGTPAFFVNGKLVSGAQPYSVFKQIIDAELAK